MDLKQVGSQLAVAVGQAVGQDFGADFATAAFGPEAGALGGAIGKYVGGEAGQALANALFGSSGPDNFDSLVLSRLDVIETEVKSVLQFLAKDLPALTKQMDLEALVENEANSFDGEVKVLKSRVDSWSAKGAKHSANDRQDLVDAAQTVLNHAYTLIKADRGWYLKAVQAFSVAFTAYSLVETKDKSTLVQLRDWASWYFDVMSPWVTHGGDSSLVDELAADQATLTDATAIMNLVPTGTTGSYRCLCLVQTPLFKPIGQRVSRGIASYFRVQPDGSLWNQFGLNYTVDAHNYIDEPESQFLPNNFGVFGYAVAPFWTPPILGPNHNRPDLDSVHDQLAMRIQAAVVPAQMLPGKTKLEISALATLRPFVLMLQGMKSTTPKAKPPLGV